MNRRMFCFGVLASTVAACTQQSKDFQASQLIQPQADLRICLGRDNIKEFYSQHIEYSDPNKVIDAARARSDELSSVQKQDPQSWHLSFSQPQAPDGVAKLSLSIST